MSANVAAHPTAAASDAAMQQQSEQITIWHMGGCLADGPSPPQALWSLMLAMESAHTSLSHTHGYFLQRNNTMVTLI